MSADKLRDLKAFGTVESHLEALQLKIDCNVVVERRSIIEVCMHCYSHMLYSYMHDQRWLDISMAGQRDGYHAKISSTTP